VSDSQCQRTGERLRRIVAAIRACEDGKENAALGEEDDAESLRPGSLVFVPVLGVTMLSKPAEGRRFYPINLSDSSDQPKPFGLKVRAVLIGGRPFELFQRTYGGLVG
jgi:hypothetical protein